MAQLIKTAIQASDIEVGDDVISMTRGRITVASVEPAPHNMLRVTSTYGLTLTVTKTQLFFRMTIA